MSTKRAGASVRMMATVLWLTGTMIVKAQLIASESECTARWGPSTSTQDIGSGVRIITYANAGYRIEATMIGGVARRVVYRGLVDATAESKTILDSNSSGLQWAEWQVPGMPATGKESRRWIRSDDMAKASLVGDTFTITAGTGAGTGGEPPPGGAEATGGANEPTNTPTPVSGGIANNGSNNATAPAVTESVPALPNDLPALGASRKKALEILGEANGWLRTGDEEVLTYPWGHVFLTNGKVVAIRQY